MDNNHNQQGKTCKCEHHKMIPALIVFIGLDFFLRPLGIINQGLLDLTWPLFVIFGGLVAMNEDKCGCC